MHSYHPLSHHYILYQVFCFNNSQREFYNYAFVNSQWNVTVSPFLYKAPKLIERNVEKCRQTLCLAKEKKATLAYNEMVREWNIRDAELAYLISDYCPNIEKISCSGEIANARAYPSMIHDLIKSWKNLRSISLSHKNGTDESLTQVSIHCTELEELVVVNGEVTDLGICEVVKRCRKLKEITLHSCKEITDETFVSMSKYCKLSKLQLKHCPRITDKGILALANPTFTKRLRYLHLEDIGVRDSLLALAEHTNTLEGLCFNRLKDVDDEVVSAFGRNASYSLKQLRVYSCRSVKGWGVMEFGGIKGLSLMMDTLGLEQLSGICEYCKDLEDLTLDVRRIVTADSTMDIVREISKLTKLKSLAIFCGKKFHSSNVLQLKKNCKKLKQINFFRILD
ncbi:17739_t:CDS:2 [Acaulospora morrowiae]|uniref:17739_t:CDS:1 n=1 Tax=Acaulospora morrowiae TaxID=94023 RepID=A0A9N8WHD7_9GLOM|nr:17739_t:CDS:2 [Acaulospora morrowiae]